MRGAPPQRGELDVSCRGYSHFRLRLRLCGGALPRRSTGRPNRVALPPAPQCCTELRCVFAQQNCLTSLAPLAALPHLDTLNVTANRLTSLDGLDAMPVLTSLQVCTCFSNQNNHDASLLTGSAGGRQLADDAGCAGVSAALRHAVVA